MVFSFCLRETALQNLILRKGSCLNNVHLRSNFSKTEVVIFIEILKRSNEKGFIFLNQFGLLLELLHWFSGFLFVSTSNRISDYEANKGKKDVSTLKQLTDVK